MRFPDVPPKTRFFLAVASFLSILSVASAQIEVAPTRVMLSMRERSREVNVINNSSNPVEVTADLGFKLIRSDSLGRLSLDTTATPEEASRSCERFLKIFPRKFILAPGSSRMVRVLIVPSDEAEEGEYWGRIIFGSTPIIRTPAEDTSDAIRTNLTMRIELDLPVIFRKGNVQTGIEFEGLSARNEEDATVALLDTKRTGNSAYRGTLVTVLKGPDGSEVSRTEEQYTTEFRLRKRITFPKLGEGNYTLEVESKSVKRGAANEAVIPAQPVTKTYDVMVSKTGIQIASK
jgi:P pilus assembly chaperone PapD